VLRIGTRGKGLCLVLYFQLAIGQGAEMGVGVDLPVFSSARWLARCPRRALMSLLI
jgi:hypothetical protein